MPLLRLSERGLGLEAWMDWDWAMLVKVMAWSAGRVLLEPVVFLVQHPFLKRFPVF